MTSNNNKIYPGLNGEDGVGSDPPPAYEPYQPAQVNPNQMPTGMHFGMQQQAMTIPIPTVQWLTPGASGAMGLLDDVEEVRVEQNIDMMQVMQTPMAMLRKRFVVKNKNGAQLFVLQEDAAHFTTAVNYRGFRIIANDCHGQEVFAMTRDSRFCSYCCFCFACCECCSADADVEINGRVVGKLRQKCSGTSPVFEILDGEDKQLMNVQGSTACCVPSRSFHLTKSDDGEQGRIMTEGLVMAASAHKHYALKFPRNCDAYLKAFSIAMAVLANFRLHSNAQGGRRRGR